MSISSINIKDNEYMYISILEEVYKDESLATST